MLNKINKYKFILIFSLFVLFLLFSNKINATSIEFEYGGKKYNTLLPNEEATNYVVFVASNNNIYLSFTKSLYLSTTNKADFVQCYKFEENKFGSYREGIRYKDNSGNNLEEFRYILNGSNWEYKNAGWDGLIGSSITLKSILFSNCDVYNNSCNTVIHESDVSASSSFHLEYNENLKSYVVYSEWYGITDSELYAHQHYYQFGVSPAPTFFDYDMRDLQGWANLEGDENLVGPGLEFNSENDKVDMDVEKVRWRVGLQILDYGTYYFVHYLPLSDNKDYEIIKFVIGENGNAYFEIFDNNSREWTNRQELDNIEDVREKINNYNSYDYFDLFYMENSENAFIYTNWFLSDNNYRYLVEYSLNNQEWSDSLDIEEYTSTYDYFRYTLNVNKNGTYYFRLRIFNVEDNSFVKSKILKVEIKQIGYDFDVSEGKVNHYLENRSIYRYFKRSLGSLFYPIELMFDFMNKLDTISETEPSIVVPTVREYFTGAVIIQGFTFSLNDVLVNETISNVYNIYLCVADFILYYCLLSFIYKVTRDFMNFGGGVS